MTETVSLEVAIEVVLRNGPTFETIAGLCKMAVEADRLTQPEQEPEPVPEKKWIYGTPLLDAMTQDYVPTQRPWQGLTDDEIEDFVSALWPVGVGAGKLLRAIEAKLKEKNT